MHGRTKVDGKEEKSVELNVRDWFCGSVALGPSTLAGDDVLDLDSGLLSTFGPVFPSFPIFRNHPKITGSFPLTQVILIPSNPISLLPLEQTAANASPICLNGTRALPVLGGLSDGVFPLIEVDRTIEDSSVEPNRDNKEAMEAGVVSVGYVFSGYFNRTVVSSGSKAVAFSTHLS